MRLDSGVIRGGMVRIEMTAPSLAPDEILLLCGFSPEGAKEVMAHHAVQPCGEGLDLFRIEAPLSAMPQPLSRIEVLRRGPGAEEVVPPGDGYALTGLFPASERDFVASFTWEGQRIKDPETLRFAAAQVVRHARFRPEHIAAAASIVAYRSMDLGQSDMCREALSFIDRAIAELPRLGLTRHVRTDREHLGVSLCTIRWHLCLYLGEFEEVMRSLEVGYRQLLPIEAAWSVGYNGSKLLLLYGFLLWQRGELDRAAEVFDFAFTLYKRVAASATNDNATLFNDHRIPHRIAFLGMIGKLNMAGKPAPRAMRLDLTTVADEVFRLRDKKGLAHLRRQLEVMVATMLRPGEAAIAAPTSPFSPLTAE